MPALLPVHEAEARRLQALPVDKLLPLTLDELNDPGRAPTEDDIPF